MPRSVSIAVCSITGTTSKGACSLQPCHQAKASSYIPNSSARIRPPLIQASTRSGAIAMTLRQADKDFDACLRFGAELAGSSRSAIIHQESTCSLSRATTFLAAFNAVSRSPSSIAAIASR